MPISAEAPWLNYYGAIPRTLNYPRLTIYQLVAQTARECPDLPAYEFMGRRTSYRDFLARIDRAALALYTAGIRAGDRVTICMPNTPQALDCFYALNRIGAVSNMIHPLSAEEEIRFYLDVSGSQAILTLDRFYGKVAAAAARAKRKPKLWIARLQPELKPLMRLGYDLTQGRKTPKLPQEGYTLWTDLLRKAAGTLPPDDGQCDACASILYSGGTTGTTKGICLSSYNFNALALQTIAASGYESIRGCTMLSVMPVFHGFGLGIGIHTALVGGACCILVPNFNIRTYADLLRKKHPNFIPGVPTLFEALLRTTGLEKLDMSFLMGVFSGGDSLSVELKHKVDAFLRAHNAKVQIREGYGTTECVTASCPGRYRARRLHRHSLSRYVLQDRSSRYGRGGRPRRGGRDLPVRPDGHARLSRQSEGDGARSAAAQRRPHLAAHRRPRLHGYRRLRLFPPAHQAHDHHLGLQRLSKPTGEYHRRQRKRSAVVRHRREGSL